MRTIGVLEAEGRFSDLLARVEKGEQVTFSREGRPVARLISVNAIDRPAAARAIAQWKSRRRDISLGGMSLRDLRDEGRP